MSRPTALLLAAVLVAGVASPDFAAAAPGCKKGAPARLDAGAGTPVGLDDPRCEFTVRCPASHDGKCAVRLDVTMTGTGVVSAFIRGAGGDATCMFVNECTATYTKRLKPGGSALIRCGPGSRIAATQLWIDCSAR